MQIYDKLSVIRYLISYVLYAKLIDDIATAKACMPVYLSNQKLLILVCRLFDPIEIIKGCVVGDHKY